MIPSAVFGFDGSSVAMFVGVLEIQAQLRKKTVANDELVVAY